MLDVLPAGDPRISRCRRDLRLINWLIGNHRWILRNLRKHVDLTSLGIVELGAGDGDLLSRIRQRHHSAPLIGFDRVAKPSALPDSIHWRPGDLFHHDGNWPGAVLIANLFLHHLTFEQIAQIGQRLAGVQLVLVGEGHRTPEVLRRSCVLNPFLGEVTRHDMEISLAAGFVKGELPEALGLSPADWHIAESSTLLGAHRLIALRR